MAEGDPIWLRMLERMGVNVTQLRWRLYRLEQKRAQPKQLPDRLRWLKYQHKICQKCGAVIPSDDRVCPRCEARAPSVAVYRVMRLFGIVFPGEAPVITGAFLSASVVLYVLVILISGPGAAMSQPGEMLAQLGMLTVSQHMQWQDIWRVTAFGLLHGGIMHIGFNAFAVLQLGPLLEQAIRRRRMLVLITATQIGSAIATYIWYVQFRGHPASTIGASGWLFGLIGFGVAYSKANAYLPRNVFIQWAAYAFIFGLILGANNAAHAGGFIVGFALGRIPDGPRSPIPDVAWTVLAAVSAVIWIATCAMIGISALQIQ